MKKVNSLILLINTLSKSEKKAVYLHSDLTQGKKVYKELFRLIDKQKITNSAILFEQFKLRFSEASFHPVVKYLYNFILSILVKLKVNQDKEFGLYQKILSAKILQERHLDTDYYEILQHLKKEAVEINNYYLLFIIRRMELDFFKTSGFWHLSETNLLKKQYKTSDTLKTIQQINEQSSLYELLLYRIENTSYSQLTTQKQFFTDLVVSEISLVSNLNKNVFEIQKLHQLFQANYLINAGDYKSALNSFIELDNLFKANPTLWEDTPLYYVKVLEGILESLKGIQEYDKIPYFLSQLNELPQSSLPLQAQVASIRFIYKVIPYMYREEYTQCLAVIDEYKDSLLSKIDLLSPYRYLQLSMYLSIIYLLNNQLTQARKQITRIINSDSYASIWFFRPIQLINLMIHYKLGNFELVSSRIRSIKRQNKLNKKNSKMENLLFQFFSIELTHLGSAKKEELILKIQNKYELIENENKDKKLLSIFNFKQWMINHLQT